MPSHRVSFTLHATATHILASLSLTRYIRTPLRFSIVLLHVERPLFDIRPIHPFHFPQPPFRACIPFFAPCHRVILPYNSTPSPTDWNCANGNPAVTILPNGTVFMVYRANACVGQGREALGIATADHWAGDYTRRTGGPIVSEADGSGNHEDPFVWVDGRGAYHIVSHDQSAGNVCRDTENHGCGAHLYSRDSYSWTVSKKPAYSSMVTLANGSRVLLLTRQRPQLLFDADGSPEYLFNGASFEGNNPDLAMLTHTYAFAFRGGTGDPNTRPRWMNL